MIPFIDLHCDTLYRTVSSPEHFFVSGADTSTHIFHAGLCESGCLLQCFAILRTYVNFLTVPPSPRYKNNMTSSGTFCQRQEKV